MIKCGVELPQVYFCCKCFCRASLYLGLVQRPMILSASQPFFSMTTVGMLETWNCSAVLGFSSTSSLAMSAFPVYSLASSSIVGAKALQGPHHAAQKSTRANGFFLIVSSKFASVK